MVIINVFICKSNGFKNTLTKGCCKTLCTGNFECIFHVLLHFNWKQDRFQTSCMITANCSVDWFARGFMAVRQICKNNPKKVALS